MEKGIDPEMYLAQFEDTNELEDDDDDDRFGSLDVKFNPAQKKVTTGIVDDDFFKEFNEAV